jgi:TolA-binding protein
MGRCFFHLKQYDAAIKHFTGLIQRYPKMPELPDALYYVGQSYQERGDAHRAESFYDKIESMPDSGDALMRKVRKARQALEAS